MKKFLIGLLNVFLSVFIFLLLFSFYGKTIFTGFVTGFIGELNTNILDTEFVEKNNNDDSKVKVEKDLTVEELFDSPEYKELLKNKEVQELIQKYVDTTIIGITDTNALNDVDLTEDIISFIEDNQDLLEEEYNISISDEDIDGLRGNEGLKEFTESYIEGVKSANEELSNNQKKLIKGYNFICSTLFKIILIFLIIINLFLISLLQKSFYKWINSLGVNLLSSGVLTIVLGLILNFSVNGIINRLNLNLKFDFLHISLVGLIASIIGIVFIVIYFIIKKKTKDDDMEVMYNEVSRGFEEKFDDLSEYDD